MILTPKRREVLAEARSWIGTKFGPGAVKGKSCSCVGLIVEVLTICDLSKEANGLRPFIGQTEVKHRYQIIQELNKCFSNRTDITQALTGDFILFQLNDGPKHVAFAGESGTIIHSHADQGRVVEHLIPKGWVSIMVYRLPGE